MNRKILMKDEKDEEAIMAKSKEVSTLQNQLQENTIRHRLDIAKVLTKERRTQFFHADHRERGHQQARGEFGHSGYSEYGHGGHFGMVSIRKLLDLKGRGNHSN